MRVVGGLGAPLAWGRISCREIQRAVLPYEAPECLARVSASVSSMSDSSLHVRVRIDVWAAHMKGQRSASRKSKSTRQLEAWMESDGHHRRGEERRGFKTGQ